MKLGLACKKASLLGLLDSIVDIQSLQRSVGCAEQSLIVTRNTQVQGVTISPRGNHTVLRYILSRVVYI